jgi:hypothetical protein
MADLATSRAGINWMGFLVPTNFFSILKEDITILRNSELNFKNERVALAAKRVICALGMVFASLYLGMIAWDLFWGSIYLTIKVGFSLATLLFCRNYIETSKGDKGSLDLLREKSHSLMEQRENFNAAFNYVKDQF